MVMAATKSGMFRRTGRGLPLTPSRRAFMFTGLNAFPARRRSWPPSPTANPISGPADANGSHVDQSWTLSPTGNWTAFTTAGVQQTRTHNNANEILTITRSPTNPPDPNYDLAGNNVFGPKPNDDANGMHCVYDAWNRLAKVYLDDGDTPGTLDPNDRLLEACRYDGLVRRTVRVMRDLSSGGAGVWRRRDFYHNEQWQVVEERRRTMPVAVDPQGTYICSHSAITAYAQYVWEKRGQEPLVP